MLATATTILLGMFLYSSSAAAIDLAPCASTCTVNATVYKCDEVCNAGDNCVGKAGLICDGTCDGGPNDGLPCDSDDECPDSSKTCEGGTNDGLACNTNGDCPDEVSPTKVCLCDPAGNNPLCGSECTVALECQHLISSCNGGTEVGEVCTNNSDCPGAACKPDPDQKPPCKLDVDNGKCVGAAATCDPRTSGKSVLCAVGVSDVTGSLKDEIICVGDGDVRVQARAGNDDVHKGEHMTIKDGQGNIENPDQTGSLTADLGPGDDTAVVAGNSDDLIFGGKGNDVIVACGGRNVLNGDDGNDILAGAFYCAAADLEMGSIYCGGDGNDLLGGIGPAHQCMDGGAGTDNCHYGYSGDDPDGAEDEDLGTARSCETTNVTLDSAPCGCDSSLP